MTADPIEPDHARPAISPVPVDPDTVVQFEPVGADEGYLVAAPIGSRAEPLPNGTAYVLDGGRFRGGSLTISVRLRPESGSDPTIALASFEPQAATGPVERFPLDDPGLIEAARAFRVAGTPACGDRWVVEGVAFHGGMAYLVRIEPDAPDECDARMLPDTQPVLETFTVVED